MTIERITLKVVGDDIAVKQLIKLLYPADEEDEEEETKAEPKPEYDWGKDILVVPSTNNGYI